MGRMLSALDERFPDVRRRLLAPFVRDVDPDRVSLLGFVVAVLSGGFFAFDLAVGGGVLAVVNGFLDVLDGAIATEYGRTSPRGNFVDHLLDRVSDVAIMAGVALHPAVPFWLGMAALVAVLLVSYAGTQYEAVTGVRLYAGFMGRSDRLVVLLLAGVADLFVADAVFAGVVVILAGSVVTFVQRIWEAWKRFGA